MDITPAQRQKFTAKPKKDRHLHSINHVLADELSRKFNEPKRFGFYLRMAIKYNHSYLRRIAGYVLETGSAKKPGALFAFMVKKENEAGQQKVQAKIKARKIPKKAQIL